MCKDRCGVISALKKVSPGFPIAIRGPSGRFFVLNTMWTWLLAYELGIVSC
jgi:hypothetical protein